MKTLPLFFDLNNHPVLVVGAGTVGTRRAQACARAGALVDIVSQQISPLARQICERSGGSVKLRTWRKGGIENRYRLVVAATSSVQINHQIALEARSLEILINVATDSKLSDVSFPTVIHRDPITIAVSSGSTSPILARVLGERIDAMIPAAYGSLGLLVRKFRDQVRSTLRNPIQQKQFWEKVLKGPVAETVFSGNLERAEQLLVSSIEAPQDSNPAGEVYLIGAGPGDPDLLTFRAYRLLQQSDVVLYDRLVSDRILDQINPDAEMNYVGKQRDQHSVPQHAINQQLVDHALAGKRVARLKGGDPFIFGRGGEEIELLAKNKIPFQVVPGITAASGCASYSGIPLTHRDHAQSVRFVTGQLQDNTVNLPWEDLIAPKQTLVIYMGLKGLPIIVEQLINHGIDPNIPAALIEQGTTPEQKVHCATLEALPRHINSLSVKPPTLLIIGTVVTLHESLNWFVATNN